MGNKMRKMQVKRIKIDSDIFNKIQRYTYLSNVTDMLIKFAFKHNLDATVSVIERALALNAYDEVNKIIIEKYVKPCNGVRWELCETNDHLLIRVLSDEDYELADIIPSTDSYNDLIARTFPEIGDKRITDVTFQVTEQCNLRCTYCYQINKTHNVMSYESAVEFIDLLFNDQIPYCSTENSYGVVFEFIGGEPFLEIDLIDKVTEYILQKAIILNHPWKNFIKFSFSSNGTLYRNPKVQEYLRKYKNLISLGISIDGNKALHDKCRVFEDGSGSYDLAIDAAIDWANKNHTYLSTKMTLSPENIEYTSEAIIDMIKNGFRVIYVNCVYEEGWTIRHARILYREMQKIYTWMFDNNAYDKAYVRLFSENDFVPRSQEQDGDKNWCGGTGEMLAMDYTQTLYPCLRYMPSSLGDKIAPITSGKIENGKFIQSKEEADCMNCLKCITRRTQSTDECYYCPIASGCGWCSAYNYQAFGTVNKRATFICWMHKARALANIEFWDKYSEITGIDKRIVNHMKPEWIKELQQDINAPYLAE